MQRSKRKNMDRQADERGVEVVEVEEIQRPNPPPRPVFEARRLIFAALLRALDFPR